jgi:hypothetical protein
MRKLTLEERITRLEKLITNEKLTVASVKEIIANHYRETLASLSGKKRAEFLKAVKDDAYKYPGGYACDTLYRNALDKAGVNADDAKDFRYSHCRTITDYLKKLAAKDFKNETELDDDTMFDMLSGDVTDNVRGVKRALELGGDPNSNYGSMWYPLERAVNSGNTKTVKLLLKAGADPEICGAVFTAAEGHPESLKILIAAGADVNRIDTRTGMSPLDNAIAHAKPSARMDVADLDEDSIDDAATLCERILLNAGAKKNKKGVRRGSLYRDHSHNG